MSRRSLLPAVSGPSGVTSTLPPFRLKFPPTVIRSLVTPAALERSTRNLALVLAFKSPVIESVPAELVPLPGVITPLGTWRFTLPINVPDPPMIPCPALKTPPRLVMSILLFPRTLKPPMPVSVAPFENDIVPPPFMLRTEEAAPLT